MLHYGELIFAPAQISEQITNTLRPDKAGSVIQAGNKSYTVIAVSIVGRGIIKSNDVEESMLLPFKGHVRAICAGS